MKRMSALSERRLQKELHELLTKPPVGIEVDRNFMDNNDLKTWQVKLTGAVGTLYQGEKFLLQFTFSSKYPIDSPDVTFVGDNIPKHPHIYSNGHICLNILTDDWSPALSVESICLSVMSMLSSCKKKKRPIDDSLHVSENISAKKIKWWFHDDSI